MNHAHWGSRVSLRRALAVSLPTCKARLGPPRCPRRLARPYLWCVSSLWPPCSPPRPIGGVSVARPLVLEPAPTDWGAPVRSVLRVGWARRLALGAGPGAQPPSQRGPRVHLASSPSPPWSQARALVGLHSLIRPWCPWVPEDAPPRR